MAKGPKVVNLHDYRETKYQRAVKKQKRDRLISRLDEFLERADTFFKLVGQRRDDGTTRPTHEDD